MKQPIITLFILLLTVYTTTSACPTCVGFNDHDSRPFFEQYTVPAHSEIENDMSDAQEAMDEYDNDNIELEEE